MTTALLFPEPVGPHTRNTPREFLEKSARARSVRENILELLAVEAGGPDHVVLLRERLAELDARLPIIQAAWRSWEAANPDESRALEASLLSDAREELEALRQTTTS